MDKMEKRQISHEIKTDDRFKKVFEALEDKSLSCTESLC